MASTRFTRLSESAMDEFLRWNPIAATHVGWHRYDHLLPDPSHKMERARLARMGELATSFERFPKEELDDDQALDRDLAVYLLDLTRFELGVIRRRHHESTACEEIGEALFYLTAKQFAPLDHRLESVCARLEGVAEFLERSKEVLDEPYRLWNEQALRSGRRIPEFIRSILEMAEKKSTDTILLDRLRGAVRRAAEDVEAHNRWLETEVLPRASKRYSIDYNVFARYVELKRLGVTPEEALSIAHAHLEAARERRKTIAEEVVGSGDPFDAIASVRKDHPKDFDQVMEEYRRCVGDAREFLKAKGLMTLPSNERLEVIETPVFMRAGTPFAAQYEPGKFDDRQVGLFLVTPHEGSESSLEDHNHAAITNTAVHEGYPGHHLQGICSNTNSSHLRALVQAPDFAEGWGLYTEDLMISQGFRDGPRERLIQVNDLIYRILRVIADVELSRGKMSPQGVAEMLAAETGISEGVALDEAYSYCMAPTYFMSYFIGKLQLLRLKRDVELSLGERFSLSHFHDSMLYSGTLPMEFMRRAVDIRLKKDYGVTVGPARGPLLGFALELARQGKS
jgi:uncharacterized protein (DUF885 family)